MARPETFGYFLIGLSAIFFALHWQQWREWVHSAANSRRREFVRRQLQRRMVASGLIGVVGAAITLVNQLPPNPVAMTAYLFAPAARRVRDLRDRPGRHAGRAAAARRRADRTAGGGTPEGERGDC